MSGTIAVNPIKSGFYPDPSICRVGESFYLVNSSFAYFPGVPIFRSKDLAHWEQIGNILDRESQLPLEGCGHSAGIYAPTIRYYDGTFYMITTNVSGGGNFIVTAERPEGPWSEPYYLGDEAPGIDPSLFFDEDGTCYYCGTRPNPEGVRYNGDWEIWVQKLDLQTMKLVGESKKIWKGAMKDVIWPEGPHLYKRNDWYYVMHAEGGTGPDHCVAIARSKSITGPYEGYPSNPVVTHRHLGAAYPIRYVGHGDLVEVPWELTASGKQQKATGEKAEDQPQESKWYMVMLASRPCEGYTNMGRETFLAEVVWENDWPVVNPGIGKLTDTVNIDMEPVLLEPEPVTYHFNGGQLPYAFLHLRNPKENLYSLREREGYLRLHLQPETLKELGSPAYVCLRQCHFNFVSSAMFEFQPQNENEVAGIALMQSNQFHLRVEIGDFENNGSLSVKAVFAYTQPIEGEINGNDRILPIEERIEAVKGLGQKSEIRRIFLKLVCRGQKAWIYAAINEEKYSLVVGELPIWELSTEVAGGFVGNTVGMYASANGVESANHADFGWFSYEEGK